MLLQSPPASQLGTRLPIQDYNKLRRQCLANNTLFEDPYFPADSSSLFYTQTLPFTPKWIRPKVLTDTKVLTDSRVWLATVGHLANFSRLQCYHISLSVR